MTDSPARSRRLPTGGDRIDRSRPVAFTFDGRSLTGFHGDTLASALLANGIDRVATSIYDGRPRGVMTAGMEEPNALVQVTWPGGASEPMVRATQVELVEGLRAESLAGKGRLSDGPPDPGRFDRRYVHTDVLVVGAGAAGLAAAEANRGRRAAHRRR